MTVKELAQLYVENQTGAWYKAQGGKELTNQLTKDEIKPGDHITVSGEVIKIDDYYGHIYFVTTSGLEIYVNPLDIQTHRPMGGKIENRTDRR